MRPAAAGMAPTHQPASSELAASAATGRSAALRATPTPPTPELWPRQPTTSSRRTFRAVNSSHTSQSVASHTSVEDPAFRATSTSTPSPSQWKEPCAGFAPSEFTLRAATDSGTRLHLRAAATRGPPARRQPATANRHENLASQEWPFCSHLPGCTTHPGLWEPFAPPHGRPAAATKCLLAIRHFAPVQHTDTQPRLNKPRRGDTSPPRHPPEQSTRAHRRNYRTAHAAPSRHTTKRHRRGAKPPGGPIISVPCEFKEAPPLHTFRAVTPSPAQRVVAC